MKDAECMQALGFFGGTFNPVHYGHLRAALEFHYAFDLQRTALLPCRPAHRAMPDVSDSQRLTMLRLAVQDSAILTVDTRELDSDALSYTLDTLTVLRREVGADVALYFALGSDAFNDIESWHDWQALFDVANLVVLHRPGVPILLEHPFLQAKKCVFSGIHQTHGGLYELAVSALDVSSTQIRALCRRHQALDYLVPSNVAAFIAMEKLYCDDDVES